MIIQHPLAAMNLGGFKYHLVVNLAQPGEQANWATLFYYENGIVRMEVVQNNYKYHTFNDKPAESYDHENDFYPS